MIMFMPFYRCLLLLSLVLFSITPASVAQAAQLQEPCTGLSQLDWTETRTGSFALLYPEGDEIAGRAVSLFDPEVLDAEYARFSALFEASLSLPVSIRVYPTAIDYYCLNGGPPEIPAGMMHSHIGAREIAFIAENILVNFQGWVSNHQDMFRYEQAVLFAEQITAGQAPPGLLAAIGRYVQDPFKTIGPLDLSIRDGNSSAYPWQDLWDSTSPQDDFGRQLHATSTVAYLLDEHGWAPFLGFLKNLATSQGYRASLSQAYGLDFAELDKGWQAYVPRYFSGRWQANLIYNYDLSPFQDQLNAGNYAEAAKGLQEVIAFLEKINASAKLNQARDLLRQAATGAEANDLVIESRQALAGGDYSRSIDLLDRAQEKYSQIRFYHRMDELNTYRAQVQEILSLHADLERLGDEIDTRPVDLSLASRLLSLSQRLGKLGDSQGLEQVRSLALRLEGRQRNVQTLLAGLGALVVLFLLGLRIALLWRRPAPEAEL